MLCLVCYAEGTLLLCHFGPPQTLTRTEKAAKSNHSRTSGKCARKSNYSRTYAKTGGWGVSEGSKGSKGSKGNRGMNCKRAFLRPLFTSTLSDIVGAPTFLSLAPPLSFFRILLNLKLTTDHLKLPKPNHSRTYAKSGGGA